MDLFGLRFASPCPEGWRWVELGKPLRKQLSRLAGAEAELSLAVFHYAPLPNPALAHPLTRFDAAAGCAAMGSKRGHLSRPEEGIVVSPGTPPEGP